MTWEGQHKTMSNGFSLWSIQFGKRNGVKRKRGSFFNNKKNYVSSQRREVYVSKCCWHFRNGSTFKHEGLRKNFTEEVKVKSKSQGKIWNGTEGAAPQSGSWTSGRPAVSTTKKSGFCLFASFFLSSLLLVEDSG